MDKFIDINLIDTLRSIMETNTVHYKTDFNYDIDTITNAAKSDTPYEKVFLWLSRPSGTQCYHEHQAFQQGTGEHNGWQFYSEQVKNDRILAYAVEIDGIDADTGAVRGNLYELDHSEHSEHLRTVSVRSTDVTLFFKNGDTQRIDNKDFHHENFDMRTIDYHWHEPVNPENLAVILQQEKRNRDNMPITEKTFDEHINKLNDGCITFEAERISNKLKTMSGANSPDRKSLMVELSPYFSNIAPHQELAKLMKAIPYKSIEIKSIEKGTYAVVRASEVEKSRKSVLSQLSENKKSIAESAKTNKQENKTKSDMEI